MKIKVFNTTHLPIDLQVINAIEKYFSSAKDSRLKKISLQQINLIICTPLEIRRLNREIFKANSLTDVISINLNEKDLLGEVYICPEKIQKNSEKFRVTFEQEFARVVIHGILHLAGFDHKSSFKGQSDEEMFSAQECIVNLIFRK